MVFDSLTSRPKKRKIWCEISTAMYCCVVNKLYAQHDLAMTDFES